MATARKQAQPFAKDNLYFVGDILHFRKMVQGHQINRSTKTGDIKVARQLAAVWEAEAITSIVRDGVKPLTLKQLMDRYMAEREGKPSYRSGWINFNRFEALFNVQVSKVDKHEVVKVINAMRAKGQAVGTIAGTIRYWNGLMKYALKNKVEPGPKLENIRDIPGNDRWLTHDEEERLLAALTPPSKPCRGYSPDTINCMHDNKDLVVALLDLGCRYHEAANLSWGQVDFKNNLVHLKRGKGGTDSTHYLTDRLREVFLNRRKEDEEATHVFPTMLNKEKKLRFFKTALTKAGITDIGGSVVLHTLRHTYANRMLKADLSLPEVQQLLGHKHVQTTMRYIHLHPTSTAARALEAQKRMQEERKQT